MYRCEQLYGILMVMVKPDRSTYSGASSVLQAGSLNSIISGSVESLMVKQGQMQPLLFSLSARVLLTFCSFKVKNI